MSLRPLTHAIRTLTRTPVFTTVAIATLALGIGANTALFSVVNGVLLRSLPFEDSHELAFLPRPGTDEADVSIPDGVDLRAQLDSFDEIALFLPFHAFDLTGDGDPERVRGSAVEPDYFRVLRTPPIMGRALTEADNVVGGERVAVISAGFWSRVLGEDPDVIGRSVTLTGEPWTIVGVMPPEFDLFEVGTEVWAPIAVATPWTIPERGTNNLEAIARVGPGISMERASTELTAVTRRLAEAYPGTNQSKILEAVPLREFLVGDSRAELLVLFAGVGLVLLIACVNLANMLMVRATSRERDVAVRMALGGGRGRITLGMFAESVVLALAGGALGAWLAVWGTEALIALAPDSLPRADSIALDASVLGFTLGLCLLTALLFGLAPAVQMLRKDPAQLLGGVTSRVSVGRGRQRLLGSFVVAEIALACLLLVGSGLMFKSFLSLRAVDLGFEPAHVLTANLVLPESRYSEPPVQTAAFERIVQSLEEAPGVESGAFVIGAPLTGYGAIGAAILFDDRPLPDPGDRPSARVRPVLGDYFRSMGVPIMAGRAFGPGDERETSPPVAIVNRAFAELYWPDESPVGKRVALLYTSEPYWMNVIGVAGDVEQNSVSGGDVRTVYLPYHKRPMSWARFGTLIARGTGDPVALREAMQEAVWSEDPAVPFDRIAPMSELVSASVAPQRFTSALIGIFAIVALLIAVQGIYGVLSYVVAQRYGEIGIRMALGAHGRDVLGLVLRRGVMLTLIGLVIGLGAAFGVTRFLSALLFEVSATDAATFILVAAVLLVTALIACGIPARRATRVDPLIALRYD